MQRQWKILCFYLIGALLALSAAQESSQKNGISAESTSTRRAPSSDIQGQPRPRQTTSSSSNEDDDDKKTLAEQVADGKYGLIQKELFANPAERPGIISYEVNPEVPRDNVNNLGGLQPEEIWLAENHLLVLKGGGFSEQSPKVAWPPIDNYLAPQRQVKIPPHPKVPPPFPVQLKEGGPIEFIRGSNDSAAPPFFGLPLFFPGTVNGSIPGNLSEVNGPPPFPYPPFPLPPGNGWYPPAAAFLPPPGNLTELDEDDPSIYYPPPYDFIYHKDNSSFVPPGPLVPGIILPPPPNFFAAYQEKPLRTKPTRKKVGNKVKTHFSTRRPTTLTITTTDNTQNEIPTATLPPGSETDWIPIPAPRPFYITDLKTLKAVTVNSGDKTKTKYDLSSAGWVVQNSSQVKPRPEKIPGAWAVSYDYPPPPPPQKKGRQFTTTEYPYNSFSPIYVTDLPESTTYAPTNPEIKLKKEYYLYEEPQISQGKLIEPIKGIKRPAKPFYDYNRNIYTTNKFTQPNPYINSQQNTPNKGRFNGYYNDPYSTVSTPQPPINFYYYKKPKQLPNFGIPYNPPQLDSPQPEQTVKNYRPKIRTTTEKPPIFEYSFSAPGYGSIEAPKVSTNYGSTSKPQIYEPNYAPVDDHRYSYFEYSSTPKPTLYEEETSTRQPYYSTARPQQQADSENYNYGTHNTVAPYTTLIDQDPRLLDDITKTYFTIFGQKINDQVTTPLPPHQEKPFYPDDYRDSPSSTTEGSIHNIKFPEEQYQQSDQPYYTRPGKVASYVPAIRRPKPGQSIGYANFYGISSPQYQPYPPAEDIVRPGHQLHSDLNVNYKKPLPLEPDAELIPSGPREGGSSFISYELPGGSGGHFYFLTPQVVNPGGYGPPQSPGSYYKRSAKTRRKQPKQYAQ